MDDITRETVDGWLDEHVLRMMTLQATSSARLEDLDRALDSGDEGQADALQTTLVLLNIQIEDCDDAILACETILQWTGDQWASIRNDSQQMENADELFSRAMPKSD